MKKELPFSIIIKRFKRKLKSKQKKKEKRFKILLSHIALKNDLGEDNSLRNQLDRWLPETVKYFINVAGQNFLPYKDLEFTPKGLTISIPKDFCLNTNIKTSLSFINTLVQFILTDNYKAITIDYSKCKSIDLSAQICLDALLIDTLKFIRKRDRYFKTRSRIKSIGGENIENFDVRKILFSIGSPAIINKKSYEFPDIVPYHLCIHNKESESLKNSRRKELDTTNLVQHVIDSLVLINKELSQDSIEDLSTVIGEILINAEEHSSLNQRYSTGYFQKIDNPNLDKAFGIYHLVILNFGSSIYEIFKSPDCKNLQNVEKMHILSEKYTQKKLFSKTFHEGSLWTLYSLQEGITSTSPLEFKKRGNGSIRFIESFFNLRSSNDKDKISRLNIISGNTNILFDGSYDIIDKTVGKDTFKVMTFNKSGNIEDRPDGKFVKKINTFFPGTIITAKILITENDFI
ncbi:MAG: hypothetical protein DI622_09240 [Chryseobacterium sp.]|uniref:hypothetical protein n=1 Tax=Chryseobacterium sp. TaxID=1871047 RepID=UPI000DB1FBAD|nr:hypothetical protein [Chryseobacterium sp.]MPS66647.1 hypothetical protein [Chryseobacterium sp.]PZU19065.1 MAG: hypothetical protein DI622_09240 [Chryseobacterium sp.]